MARGRICGLDVGALGRLIIYDYFTVKWEVRGYDRVDLSEVYAKRMLEDV